MRQTHVNNCSKWMQIWLTSVIKWCSWNLEFLSVHLSDHLASYLSPTKRCTRLYICSFRIIDMSGFFFRSYHWRRNGNVIWRNQFIDVINSLSQNEIFNWLRYVCFSQVHLFQFHTISLKWILRTLYLKFDETSKTFASEIKIMHF